jgi:hypothetical protein
MSNCSCTYLTMKNCTASRSAVETAERMADAINRYKRFQINPTTTYCSSCLKSKQSSYLLPHIDCILRESAEKLMLTTATLRLGSLISVPSKSSANCLTWSRTTDQDPQTVTTAFISLYLSSLHNLLHLDCIARSSPEMRTLAARSLRL